jgi:hypothetical protein
MRGGCIKSMDEKERERPTEQVDRRVDVTIHLDGGALLSRS